MTVSWPSADIGVIGRGPPAERSIEAAAAATFAVTIDPATVGGEQTLTADYDESDMEIALLRWLNDSPTARTRQCGETGTSGSS